VGISAVRKKNGPKLWGEKARSTPEKLLRFKGRGTEGSCSRGEEEQLPTTREVS